MILKIEHKLLDSKISSEPGERWVLARISTTAVDREGDVLLPSGADMSQFEKNPVVLFIHEAGKLPIGKAVGIRKRPNDIVAKVLFAERPQSLPSTQEWVPDTVHDLFKQGVLRAFSVGFQVPLGGARMAELKDKGRFGDSARRIITKWKLVELSVVPVPMNQDALAISVSKGILPAGSWVRDQLGPMDDLLDTIEMPDPPLTFDTHPPLRLS